ncbi:MAG: hypothetical protein HFF02_08765 [Erysipelotrichaceae bacterium]|jgi:hypothetical protein|nr:hypothetical protein [Erysipelotrichaceae bacterium]
MDQYDKLLISLLNLHSSDVCSIHSACDDNDHFSVFVTLARKKFLVLIVVVILVFLMVIILETYLFLTTLSKTPLFS